MAKLLIIEELSKGTPFEKLRRDNPELPNSGNLSLWKEDDAAFAKDFAHARELGYDKLAYDCLEIANNGSNDWMANNDPDNPGYKFNGEHVQRSKLRIETIIKLLSKWDPKRYGDRQVIELDASDKLMSVIKAAESRLKLADKVDADAIDV